jgi:hypothetical protein
MRVNAKYLKVFSSLMEDVLAERMCYVRSLGAPLIVGIFKQSMGARNRVGIGLS